MLMCHHVYEEVLDIINFFDDVSFDDGLYSVYKYRNKITSKNKILFITPKLVNQTNYNKCTSAKDAMYSHFVLHDNSPYMTIQHIIEMSKLGFKIGYHGFTHDVIIHGFNKNQIPTNSWRFYKYPELVGKEKYYIIDSCLSCAGYRIKNGISRISEDEYQTRVYAEIRDMLSFFSVYDIPIFPFFAPPFNSINSFLESVIREYLPDVQIFSSERKDICELVPNYYNWKGEN